jgi:hypothetical protein
MFWCETGGSQVAKNEDWKRRRTRVDPLDLGEAILAAQSITDHLESQVEIASKLMGMSGDEVRQAVLQAAPLPLMRTAPPTLLNNGSRAVVVIERRSRRTVMTRPRDQAGRRADI